MAWTDERIETLKRLWSEGYSAAVIAHELGGVSRNGVLGKVHRLGLSGRTVGVRKQSGPRSRKRANGTSLDHVNAPQPSRSSDAGRAVEPHRPSAPSPLPPIDETAMNTPLDNTKGCQIEDLTERRCKWPLGRPGEPDFAFCGARKDLDTPYCAHHARTAFNPVQSNRKPKAEKEA